MTLLARQHPLTETTASSALIRAYRGDRPEATPVWFMRQAGRSLPEYRELRAGTQMLATCREPELVTEITLQPVRRHGVDAAILFSDIVVPLDLIGVGVEIVPGKGPVIAEPVRTAADVARLRALTDDGLPEDLFEPITDAVSALVGELGATPLIGFAGAPFTLAAYLVEGGPSKDQLAARTLMHSEPQVWADLMSWLAELTGAFLHAQVSAGASAAQLFDSWAGGLSLSDYVGSVAQYSARALAPVRAIRVDDNAAPAGAVPSWRADSGGPVPVEAGGRGFLSTAEDTPGAGVTGFAGDAAPGARPGSTVPTVHFGVGTGHLLRAMHGVGVDVLGIDYRTPLDQASHALPGVALQGNIDPALLSAGPDRLDDHVADVLRRGRAAPAHVLNLGHGVPPDTDPDVLTRLVDVVRR